MPEDFSVDKQHQNMLKSSKALNLTNHNNNKDILSYNIPNGENNTNLCSDDSNHEKFSMMKNKSSTFQSSPAASSFFINDILKTSQSESNMNQSGLSVNNSSKLNLGSYQNLLQSSSNSLLQASSAFVPKRHNLIENINQPEINNEDMFLSNQNNPYHLAFINGILRKTIGTGFSSITNMDANSIKTAASKMNVSETCISANSFVDESRDYCKDDMSSISDEKDSDNSGIMNNIYLK